VGDALVTVTIQRPVTIRFLTARPGVLPLGTVSTISGLDDVRSSSGVLDAGLYFGPGTTITPVRVDADRRGYIVATGSTPSDALALADAAAGKLVVRTQRHLHVLRNARLLPAATVAVAAAAGAVALLAFHGGIRPRLVSDTIRARGALFQVRYVFNEPVRALLIVNGKPASSTSSLRRSGALQWRRQGTGGSVHFAIEGTDRSGRHAIVMLNRARAEASVRRPAAT
jgi:hypothetical protein